MPEVVIMPVKLKNSHVITKLLSHQKQFNYTSLTQMLEKFRNYFVDKQVYMSFIPLSDESRARTFQRI